MKKGIGASKGYAVGTAYVLHPQEDLSFQTEAKDSALETERLQQAIERSKAQVKKIAEQSGKSLDAKDAAIVSSHLKFLEDPAFVGEAFSAIQSKPISAEKAISDITQSLCALFSEFDDAYTRERAADIRDVGDRILRNLVNAQEDLDFHTLPENTVLVAHDLKPSQTAQIDRNKVVGLVTEAGGKTSHTAILAKALGIAAVVGCSDLLSEVKTGDSVIVDGVNGLVIIRPDSETLSKYRTLAAQYAKVQQQFSPSQKVVTKDGKTIPVAANIGSLKDLEIALQNGADGVGLFRTEFLYMEKTETPTEDEQFQIYRKAAEMLAGKPLTIRTLDIGGDKSLPYLQIPKEANPFLGLRAIRLCLKNPPLFHTQLRAILRASVYGNIRIMFPMISNLSELQQAKEHLRICQEELEREKIAFSKTIKVGMMIEIPSAAVLSEQFAKEVDFFSIGTNDLTQYTLAVDRMNEQISELYNSMDPAVLRLIEMTITAAHHANIPCCMCGELASDDDAAVSLLQYGLDEFSVSPGLLAQTKQHLLQILNQ